MIQLGEGGFIAHLEDVEGVFEGTVDFCFVVVEGDDVRRFFGRWIVVLIFGGFVLSDGYEIYFDSCMESDGKNTHVDVVIMFKELRV